MFPRSVECEDCGQMAVVRGYGRIEYDWPETTMAGQEAIIPAIICVRLTVDCPHCGVKSQEFFPNGAGRSHQRSAAAAAKVQVTAGAAVPSGPPYYFTRSGAGGDNRPMIRTEPQTSETTRRSRP